MRGHLLIQSLLLALVACAPAPKPDDSSLAAGNSGIDLIKFVNLVDSGKGGSIQDIDLRSLLSGDGSEAAPVVEDLAEREADPAPAPVIEDLVERTPTIKIPSKGSDIPHPSSIPGHGGGSGHGWGGGKPNWSDLLKKLTEFLKKKGGHKARSDDLSKRQDADFEGILDLLNGFLDEGDIDLGDIDSAAILDLLQGIDFGSLNARSDIPAAPIEAPIEAPAIAV